MIETKSLDYAGSYKWKVVRFNQAQIEFVNLSFDSVLGSTVYEKEALPDRPSTHAPVLAEEAGIYEDKKCITPSTSVFQ